MSTDHVIPIEKPVEDGHHDYMLGLLATLRSWVNSGHVVTSGGRDANDLLTVIGQMECEVKKLDDGFMRMNLTEKALDEIGFSEYWDEHGTWGTRTLTFSNGDKFRIIENLDDVAEVDAKGTELFCANSYVHSTVLGMPRPERDRDLIFLHDLYEVIEQQLPDSLAEFISICRKKHMGLYIDKYLQWRKR